jgi:hypothetical protein
VGAETEPLDALTAQQRRNRALWDEFVEHYGLNGMPACVTCGHEDHSGLTLTVGHLRDDGGVQRRAIASGWKNPKATVTTPTVIAWLKKKGWPKDLGIVVQCGNCQLRDLRLEIQRRTRLQRLTRLSIGKRERA